MSFDCLLLLSILTLLGLSVDPHLKQHILPVHGNASLGYYYVNLYIGTPPQQQSVIIDTGSGQLALPCSECVSCGGLHIHRPLDIRKSSTNKIITCDSGHDLCKESCGSSQPKPCTFIISYAEGSSLSGILIEDTVQFQNGEPGEGIVTTFGCTIRETNLFYTQAANGIFGLAPKRKARLLELLYERHSKYTGEQFLFSMCLSKNGGQLAVGKISEQLTAGIESVKTKFNPYRNLYSLHNVGSISFNDTVIRQGQDLGYYGMFIDSGSTFTYFRTREYNILLQQIQNVCAFYSDICKKAKKTGAICLRIDFPQNQSIKDVLISMFPSIDIQINGKVVSWSPHRYFLLRNSRNSHQICLGVESLDRFLLGGNWMVDRNIVFDLKEQTVEIFSDVKCSESSQTEDVPLYYDNNSGSFTYIAAVFQVNEDLVARVLFFALVAVLLIVILLLIGVYCFNKQGKKREVRDMQSKELTEEVDNTIIFASNQNSSRDLEERQENKGEESNQADTEVEVL